MLTDDLRHSAVETEGFVIVSDPLPAAAADLPTVPRASPSSPVGLHRVLEPTGAAITLPQAARRLDARPELWPDEVRIAVETLNLDAASYRQLVGKHTIDGRLDGAALRAEVLDIVATRGKMQNPVTGSGGMLIGTVDAVGSESPLGLRVGDRVATLVSLSLTPLRISDGLSGWDGRSEQVPAAGHAILFGRSIAARLPADLDPHLALMVMDVCGAPALVERVVGEYAARDVAPTVAVLGAAGKSGSLSLAAARRAGAGRLIGVVPIESERLLLEPTGLADTVVLADARSPLGLSAAVEAAGGPADITVVCVDVPGCEQPAILSTAQGGTVIFFSMATNFAAAALGAEGLAADVRMLVGNGYVPGHADLALSLLREVPAVRFLFESRLAAEGGRPRATPSPEHTEQSPAPSGTAGEDSQPVGVLRDRAAEGSTP
jgi:L-erythro-3,5-diaminohexanoate dehydrogenase